MDLIKGFKAVFPKKNILIYSGYTFEELKNKKDQDIDDILCLADYLVDGKFVLKLRDISLTFRGSSNQRIIDLKKTNETKGIVIHNF